MKKLLYLKDSEEFWKVFSEEREKIRRRLQGLPFAEKVEIMARMRKLFPRPPAQPMSGGRLTTTEGDTD